MWGRFPSAGLDIELSKDLKDRVVDYRNRYIEIFLARYTELLPSLIVYDGVGSTAIHSLKSEYMLRNNFNVVIGETTEGLIQILGFVQNDDTFTDPRNIFTLRKLSEKDIHFTIAKRLRPEKMKEITYYDDCQTGNFIVLKNKLFDGMSDNKILQHYAIHIAEIALSRFSIAMQAKFNTIFLGDKNDETINQLVSDIYNGSPFVKATKLFDPDEHIYHFDNEFMAQNFVELKREFQNQISELNNMLGIPSIGVEKESGVSDKEAVANDSITSAYGNIYLSARKDGFDRLNKRYKLKIEPIFNTNVAREISSMGDNPSPTQQVVNKENKQDVSNQH